MIQNFHFHLNMGKAPRMDEFFDLFDLVSVKTYKPLSLKTNFSLISIK
jgi:hypothetical protein